jgi:hypothetical protein
MARSKLRSSFFMDSEDGDGKAATVLPENSKNFSDWPAIRFSLAGKWRLAGTLRQLLNDDGCADGK